MRRLTLTALTAALLCVAPTNAAEAAPPADFFGTVLLDQHLKPRDLNRMDKAGVGSARFAIFRQNVEPEEGEFHWQRYDALVGKLASRGVQIRPVVFGSPRHAARTVVTPPLRDHDARAGWKRFLRRAVQRYGPGGGYWSGDYQVQFPGAAALPIRTWQIWNEPSQPPSFEPRPSVRRYARLLRISHTAITGQDPAATIVLAGLFGFAYKPSFYAWNFLDRLYERQGIKRYFDVVALHPYGPEMRFVRTQVRKTRQAMNENGDRGTGLWITELGWSSGRGGHELDKGRQGQKRMLNRSFRFILGKRTRWDIGLLNWFSWRDPRIFNTPCRWCPQAGLLRRNYEPKPAWRAYKRFAGS